MSFELSSFLAGVLAGSIPTAIALVRMLLKWNRLDAELEVWQQAKMKRMESENGW